jgi:hypothetical protein
VGGGVPSVGGGSTATAGGSEEGGGFDTVLTMAAMLAGENVDGEDAAMPIVL